MRNVVLAIILATAGTPAAVALDVVDVYPKDNALDVPWSATVRVEFSEAVIQETVNDSSFRLWAGDVPVAGTVSTDPQGLSSFFTPSAPLSPDTLFRVELTSGVTAQSGGSLRGFVSRFRTSRYNDDRTLESVSVPTRGVSELAQSGRSVAPAGDINRDGIDDFLAGAPGREGPNGLSAGAALIYLGSASDTETAEPDLIFEGARPSDRAGTAVASNFDYNDDGYIDFLIGAEQYNRTLDPIGGCEPDEGCGPGIVYLVLFDPNDTGLYPNLGNPGVPDVLDLNDVGQPGGIPGAR